MGIFDMIKRERDKMKSETMAKVKAQTLNDAHKLKDLHEEKKVLTEHRQQQQQISDINKENFKLRNPTLTRIGENILEKARNAKAERNAKTGRVKNMGQKSNAPNPSIWDHGDNSSSIWSQADKGTIRNVFEGKDNGNTFLKTSSSMSGSPFVQGKKKR